MSRIHSYDTKPELMIRSMLHREGFRFRVHQNALPGNPDIVLAKHKSVIFVHGCFWHGHKGCTRARRPAANRKFWDEKLDRNIERDKMQQRQLRRLGWRFLIIWQCELSSPDRIRAKLKKYLGQEGAK